jgi:hypothetical protein
MELISKTMVHYLLKGKRNLSVEKAKIVAKKTGTDPIIWIDPLRVEERRAAWKRLKEAT